MSKPKFYNYYVLVTQHRLGFKDYKLLIKDGLRYKVIICGDVIFNETIMPWLSEKDVDTSIETQSRKFEFEMEPQFKVESQSRLENDGNSSLDDKQALAHSSHDKNIHDDYGDDNLA